MERVLEIWNTSLLGRGLEAVCLWFGRQWNNSRVVRSILAPMAGEEHSQSSIFYKLWLLVRSLLCRLYELLHLEKLFKGSMFTQTVFWCALPVLAAPVLPTMAVIGLAAVGYCALALALARDRERKLVYAPVNRFILLYAAIYLGATFTSVTPRGSLFHGVLMVFFILFALVVENNLTSWKQVEGLVFVMVLVGGGVALLGIGQYVFGVSGASAWLDSDMFDSISTRVYSTLQNPNVLAEYLLLIIPLGGAMLLSARDNRVRAVTFVCCGLMCLCMVLTFSRGGWLGLLLAGGIFVVLLKPRLMLLLPFALIVLYFALPETVINRFVSIGDLQDGSTSYRVSIWMGTLAMLKDYWLCGVGPGTAAFNLVYPAYSYNTATAQHGHNLYLQILCDGGVCAFVVFVAVIFVFCRMICGALSRSKSWRSRYYLAAAISGVGGFLVQSMTDYTFYNYRVALLFWMILGLGAVFARLSEEEAQG